MWYTPLQQKQRFIDTTTHNYNENPIITIIKAHIHEVCNMDVYK